MAFALVPANEISWLSIVNNNFSQAYAWDSTEVRGGYVPRITMVDYPSTVAADSLAVVDVEGNIVPSDVAYSALQERTASLEATAGTLQDMTVPAKVADVLTTARDSVGKTRTVGFQVTVPDGGVETLLRFSSDFLGSFRVEATVPTASAIFMASTVGPAATLIAGGSDVVVDTSGGVAPAGKVLYSINTSGLLISNNTGTAVELTILIQYSQGTDITAEPAVNKGALALSYDQYNMTEFTTLTNMAVVDGVLEAIDLAPHTATTDTYNSVNPVLNVRDLVEYLAFTDLSVADTADILRSEVEIVDGDPLIIKKDDGTLHALLASGVTTEAGPTYVMDTTAVTAGEIPSTAFSVGSRPSLIISGAPTTPAVTADNYVYTGIAGAGPDLYESHSLFWFEPSDNACNNNNNSYAWSTNWVDVRGLTNILVNSTGNRTNMRFMTGSTCTGAGSLGSVSLVDQIIEVPAGAEYFQMYYSYNYTGAVISIQSVDLALTTQRTYEDILGTNFTAMEVQVEHTAKNTKMTRLALSLWEF